MARKRLDKTIIEGGRTGSSKYDRRNSHKIQRSHERDYLKKITKDPDSYEDLDLQEQDQAHKDFSDKISPLTRWLKSKVGQPWNVVYSEIKNQFDDRMGIRDILLDHPSN